MFDLSLFESNVSKHILQIGQQLRKMTSIYRLPLSSSYEKLWLTGTKNMRKVTELFNKECAFLGFTSLKVGDVNRAYVSEEEYDGWLTKNIVLLDMFDAAANNTVLECIVRCTPLVVIKMPATVYYLGEEYPLYFTELEEVPALLSNTELIRKAHVYLKEKVKATVPSMDAFVSTLTTLCMRHIYDVVPERPSIL